MTGSGDENVFSKVWTDLKSARASIDEKGLREKIRQLLSDTARQVGDFD